MPRRTNEFQKIVFMLQRQLSGRARVTESKLVQSQDTHDKAEIDIVVEIDASGIPLIMGIECTAAKRPATVQWVQEIYGKHHPLPVQATVLVSKSGYTKNALKQARAFKMIPLTIEEAEGAKWTELVNDLKNLALGSFRFNISGGTVHYDRLTESDSDLKLSPDLLVRRGEPDDPISLSELSKALIGDSRAVQEVMRHWLQIPSNKRPEKFKFKINWRPSKNSTITGFDGCEYRLTQIDLDVEAFVVTTSISLDAGKYSGAEVAFGTAKNIFEESTDKERQVVVTITRSDEGLSGGSIMIPTFEGRADEVFDMRFPETRHPEEKKDDD